MRKLILQEWLSLDGCAADGNGKLDFFPPSETDHYSDRDQLAFLDSVDTSLLGRKTYELFKAQTGKHMVLWGSLSLARDLIAANLIDEYHLNVAVDGCGAILGRGGEIGSRADRMRFLLRREAGRWRLAELLMRLSGMRTGKRSPCGCSPSTIGPYLTLESCSASEAHLV